MRCGGKVRDTSPSSLLKSAVAKWSGLEKLEITGSDDAVHERYIGHFMFRSIIALHNEKPVAMKFWWVFLLIRPDMTTAITLSGNFSRRPG
jgi:hypothetical protein